MSKSLIDDQRTTFLNIAPYIFFMNHRQVPKLMFDRSKNVVEPGANSTELSKVNSAIVYGAWKTVHIQSSNDSSLQSSPWLEWMWDFILFYFKFILRLRINHLCQWGTIVPCVRTLQAPQAASQAHRFWPFWNGSAEGVYLCKFLA